MAGLSDAPLVEKLAVPAVCVLTAFLSYFSQYVFNTEDLDPGPLSRNESIVFNTLLLCLWFSYFRAITVDPGRFVFEAQVLDADGRWCKKCQAPKPPRAHHCRHCKRCIPKMDHHCPWTSNCVSMTTFPHFLRFLAFANVSLWTLGRLLWQRSYALWETRHMPAHLGPSLFALGSLAMIALVWSVTSLALGMMFFTTLMGWVMNRTTIEEMELSKHEANARNGGREWWDDVTGPDGEKVRFEAIEFPYDVGFFANMAQAMGTANPLLWFFPLAGHPRLSENGSGNGWTWEENGFNRKYGMWPPPDPEKLRRAGREGILRRNYEAELQDAGLSPEEQVEAFRRRQAEDLRRRNNRLMAELEEVDNYGSDGDEDSYEEDYRSGWVNKDGERLADYGVDEEAEQDEDVPIAELLRRRKGAATYKDE